MTSCTLDGHPIDEHQFSILNTADRQGAVHPAVTDTQGRKSGIAKSSGAT